MKMVSMKMKPEAKGKHDTMEMVNGSTEKYPWGLRLNLGNEQLKALGVKDLPKVGEKIPLHAMVTVVGVRSSETENGEDRNVELQITECMMEMKGGENMDMGKAGEKMFGGKA